jgi:hypothetical protein
MLDEEADFYIDAETLRVTRSIQYLRSIEDMDFRIPSILDFSDYRSVNGVQVPFRIATTTGSAGTGIQRSTTVLQSVFINRGVSPALFQKGQ